MGEWRQLASNLVQEGAESTLEGGDFLRYMGLSHTYFVSLSILAQGSHVQLGQSVPKFKVIRFVSDFRCFDILILGEIVKMLPPDVRF